jgi:hypothetical protein
MSKYIKENVWSAGMVFYASRLLCFWKGNVANNLYKCTGMDMNRGKTQQSKITRKIYCLVTNLASYCIGDFFV